MISTILPKHPSTFYWYSLKGVSVKNMMCKYDAHELYDFDWINLNREQSKSTWLLANQEQLLFYTF